MNLITPSGGLLFWMVLIFAIVFFILAKFGFPVITSMVKSRKDYIAQSLKDAAQARERLAGMQQECENMLSDTRAKQEELLVQAHKSAQQMVLDAKVQAAEEAAHIIQQAKEEINTRKLEAIRDVRNEIAGISIAVSEKILREKLSTDESQMAYIEKAINEVESQQKSFPKSKRTS